LFGTETGFGNLSFRGSEDRGTGSDEDKLLEILAGKGGKSLKSLKVRSELRLF
jgi:hypothetical protein